MGRRQLGPRRTGEEYTDVGVTWLVESPSPTGDWEDEFYDRIRLDLRND